MGRVDPEKKATIAECIFSFDEATFRKFFELYYRPHDDASGWKFMWGFFFVLLIWFLLFWFALDPFGICGPTLVDQWRTHGPHRESYFGLFCASMVAIPLASWGVVYGFRMWRGLRHPHWGTPRWEARTNAAYRLLAEGPSKSPLPTRFLNSWSPMFIMSIAWYGCTWDDMPLFYDEIPGLWPLISMIDPRRNEGPPLRLASFEVRFYPNHLEKGSKTSGIAYRYEDVFDVVEDKKLPDLAIIRIKDMVSEVVVRPSALRGESWEEVKARIRSKSDRVTLWEGFFGKKKGR